MIDPRQHQEREPDFRAEHTREKIRQSFPAATPAELGREIATFETFLSALGGDPDYLRYEGRAA
ncbi:MAG: hypothetical protein ACYSWU_27315 [Planctomycetota bacterium]|jgi:hypothetical protein